MYDGNPGKIDFGSSQHEVRVSEGSSYRESTVSLHNKYTLTTSELAMSPFFTTYFKKKKKKDRRARGFLLNNFSKYK